MAEGGCNGRWERCTAFEEELADGNCEDLVQVWCNYVNWSTSQEPAALNNRPNVILSRACYALASDVRYRNDPRHLRLWVRHAKRLPQPQKVFQFLESEGIGATQALLYEAWATSLYKQGKFKDVEAVCECGLARNVQPQERLLMHREALKKRISLRASQSQHKHKPDLGSCKLVEDACAKESQSMTFEPSSMMDGNPDATTELTTGVRALFGSCWSSHSAGGSSIFEDPTCTMDYARREVLGLFQSDIPVNNIEPATPDAVPTWDMNHTVTPFDTWNVAPVKIRSHLNVFEETSFSADGIVSSCG